VGRPSTLRINVTSDSRQAQQDMRQVETTTSKTLGKLKSAGPGMAAAAGAAIGAALISAIGEALEQGKIKAKLNAQLGVAGADAKKIGAAAGKLYTEGVTEDFQGAADAIKATMQNLVPAAPGEDLKALATRAQDLATIMDEDVGKTTQTVAKMLQTGIAKNAEEAFDVLTKGAQNGANASEDLLDTFNEYSTQFRDMGLSGKQALGLITQSLRGGARDSDVAADALKELNIRVKDLTAAPALKTLGLNAKEMAAAFATGGPTAEKALDAILDRLRKYEGTTKGVTLAQSLLGTQSEDLSKALFSMDPSTAAATQGMDNLAGASDQVGKSLRDNAGAELTKFQRTAQQVLVDFIGDKVIPALRDLYAWYKENLAPAVAELAQKYREDMLPILQKIKDGVRSVTDEAKKHERELRVVAKVIGVAIDLWMDYYGVLINYVFLAIRKIIDTISMLVRWIETCTKWIGDLVEALKRIKVPGALSRLGGLIGGLGGLVTFSAVPSEAPTALTRSAVTPSPLASPSALQRFVSASGQPIVLNVTIDGEQLQGRVNRTVRTALNADGARALAGGYI
jgi:hypothetical protein